MGTTKSVKCPKCGIWLVAQHLAAALDEHNRAGCPASFDSRPDDATALCAPAISEKGT